MASLANQTISSTYDGLVKTATDQPVPISGVQLLEDGVGNSLALSVGRANQGVTITGTLSATSISGVLSDGVTATTQTAGDNSTKVATTAYVDAATPEVDLDLAGDSGTGTVDLATQSLTISGTANEIETSASGQTITIGLPSTITANVTGNVSGDLTGTVLTAAQTNITSVGTLTGLTVSADASINSLTVGRGAGNDLRNTSLGSSALSSNTTGFDNSAFGRLALTTNTTGVGNTAIGFSALESNDAGNNNTAVGRESLQLNTSGTGNVALGRRSLYSNTTASDNTSVGTNALQSNTTGFNNTALGKDALLDNTTGNNNAAFGLAAMTSNTTGGDNAAFGQGALDDLTTGSYNLGLGRAAGTNITTGFANIVLGGFTSGGSYSPEFDVTTENNRVVMGSDAVTNAYIKVAWTVNSDQRDKTEFGEIPLGLDFVTQLNPVSYRFRKNRQSEEAVGDVKYGFIAQDILALEGENSVIIDATNPEKLRYQESNLIAVLVKSIKEQQEIINDLKTRIETLESK